MKLKTPLLSLLMIGSFSVFGSRDRPPNEIARKAVCTVRCQDAMKSDMCDKTCNSDRSDIPVLKFRTNASFGYLCQLAEGLSLQMDPGVYIVEYRNQSSDWINETQLAFTKHQDQSLMLGSLPTGWYQFRFTRAFSEGISTSHITQWVRRRKPDENPMKVPRIWLDCLHHEFEGGNSDISDSISAGIRFRPAEDASCLYYLTCMEDDAGREKIQFASSMVPDFITMQGNLTFGNLPFGKNFTVSIRAGGRGIISDETFLKFSTPLRWKFYYPAKICVPHETEDIKAIAAPNKMNGYDITVTWRKPDYPSDFYIINITSDVGEANEPGRTFQNVTSVRAKFEDVEILQEYNVSIRGWSLLGGGPETMKRFTIPRKTIDRLGLEYVIIMAIVSACVSLVMVTAVSLYLMRRRQEGEQARIASSKIITYGHELELRGDEIDPDRLTTSRILGNGAFGVVKFGKLRNDKEVIDVAVKMLQDDTNKTELRNFRLEIEVMRSLGKHRNIVSFLGYGVTGHYPFLVMEYCPRGNLLSFLHSALVETNTTDVTEKKKRFVSKPRTISRKTIMQRNPEGSSATIDATVNLTLLDMLNYGRQIAVGMEFVSSNGIVHRDLAARNILVCDEHVVKISDFGLSRNIYLENVDSQNSNNRMPIKWMAIESLKRRVYSTQSDVWSFGILLWEIFTLGMSPYPKIHILKMEKVLQSGYRMPRPKFCSQALYTVMLSCWEAKPENRPTFTELREQLDTFISVAAEHEYLDVDSVSVEMPIEEESRALTSHDTPFSLEVGFVNDRKPRIIHERLEQAEDDIEDCVE